MYADFEYTLIYILCVYVYINLNINNVMHIYNTFNICI